MRALPAARAAATEPAARLYAMVSPSLLAGLAGLLGTGLLAIAVLTRRQAATAAAAVTAAAVRQAAAEATRDRLRFLMRLDHELKNPLTAMRAGLANIDQAGAAAGYGRSAALVSVSAQALRDFTKAAELMASTQNIRELYFLCRDDALIAMAKNHGYEEMPFKVLRMKLK